MKNDKEPSDEPENGIPESPPEPTDGVGYGRPPRHSQFKKGTSGNPKGRPKGSKNVSTYIDEELKQNITVTEGGTRKRISKAKAIAKRVVNGAVSGETKMVPMLLNHDRLQGDQKPGGTAIELPLTDDDEAVLKLVIERIRNADLDLGQGSVETAVEHHDQGAAGIDGEQP